MFQHRYSPRMRLEEALKQTKPFESNYQRALVNLIFTSNCVSAQMKLFLKDYDITTKQYNILRILNGAHKPVSIAFIRDRLLDKVSDVSRIVDRMTNQGLVIKRPSEVDKRLVDIILSPTGKERLHTVMSSVDMIDGIMKNLSTQEVETLNRLLDKIRA